MNLVARMTRLAVGLLIATLLAATARADIAPDPLTTGGTTPKAMGDEGGAAVVRMAWEEVDLRPTLEKNHVRAVFGLVNTSSEPARFEVGFPSYYEGRLHDFEVRVDGENRPAELKRDDPPEGARKRIFTYWMCWPMEFAPGQEIRVEVRYWCATETVFQALWMKQLPDDLKGRLVGRKSGYVLRTGAGWAGTIGKATLHMHYGDEVKKGRLRFTRPNPAAPWTYDPEADVDTLVFEDLEPDAKSDIHYEIDAVGPQLAAGLLRKALHDGKLDPWAMKHLLEMVEKDNVFEHDDARREAMAREILEMMVPPKGPTFPQQGPGDERSKAFLTAGAEKVLRETFARLLPLLEQEGRAEDAAAVRSAYRDFLTPIALRTKAWFDSNPDKQKGWGWDQYEKLESEWKALGSPSDG